MIRFSDPGINGQSMAVLSPYFRRRCIVRLGRVEEALVQKRTMEALSSGILFFGLALPPAVDSSCPAGHGWLLCSMETSFIILVMSAIIALYPSSRERSDVLVAFRSGVTIAIFVAFQLAMFTLSTGTCLAGDYAPVLRLEFEGAGYRTLDCAFAPAILAIVSLCALGLALMFRRVD